MLEASNRPTRRTKIHGASHLFFSRKIRAESSGRTGLVVDRRRGKSLKGFILLRVHPLVPTILSRHDHPCALFLLREGTFLRREELGLSLTVFQVVGDLWERYLQLLDDGVADG